MERNGRWAIYPVTRFVPEADIYGAAADHLADGDLVLEDWTEESDIRLVPLDIVCQMLESIGVFTFTNERANEDSLKERARNEANELAAEREP